MKQYNLYCCSTGQETYCKLTDKYDSFIASATIKTPSPIIAANKILDFQIAKGNHKVNVLIANSSDPNNAVYEKHNPKE